MRSRGFFDGADGRCGGQERVLIVVVAGPVDREMRCRLENVVRAAQLGVLTLQPLQLRKLIGRRSRPATGALLGLANPNLTVSGFGPSLSATEHIASHCDPHSC